jgi:hypothetical protein
MQDKIESFLSLGDQNSFLTNLISDELKLMNLELTERNYFKDLLQIFFYNDLDVLILDSSQTNILYLKIFHYLYNGEIGDGKPFKKNIKKKIRTIDDTFVENIRENRKILEELYKYYIKKVLDIQLKTEDDTLSKVLIFEAPPFCNSKNVTSHFLFEGGTYYSVINGNESLSKKTVDFLQIREFKKMFGLGGHPNIKLEKLTPVRNLSPMPLISYVNPIYNISKWKIKKTSINDEKIKETIKRIDNVVKSDIIFLDLFLMPLELDYKVRNAWATNPKYLFEEKTLPVLLLDWAIQYLKKVCNRENTKLFSKNCLLALGIPLNTSIGIFEHYTLKNLHLEVDKDGPNDMDISRLNSPTAFLKMENPGVTFPMFKSNVIGGNNLPDYVLVRNAFNLRL